MLEACNEVVSFKLCKVSALRVNPLNTLAKFEGIYSAVFGNSVAFCKCGLKDTFNIVLKKAVVSVNDSFSVNCTVGSKCVPSLGVVCVTD